MYLKKEIRKKTVMKKNVLLPGQCTVSQVDRRNGKVYELHFELFPHPT